MSEEKKTVENSKFTRKDERTGATIVVGSGATAKVGKDGNERSSFVRKDDRGALVTFGK